MQLNIHAHLDYGFARPTDLLLQMEAAILPEQTIDRAFIDLSPVEHFARISGHDRIGDRIWLRVADRLVADYTATVTVERLLPSLAEQAYVPPHQLPGETVEYLMPSRFCQSDLFQSFVDSEFAGLEGGARVDAIRQWVSHAFRYVPGASTAETTAMDSFVRREGVCRDYAHVVATLVRACEIPARVASVYALGVEPQDFHAVAEVFVGGAWHLVDATGMAEGGGMAKIGVGRDAADVAFLSAFGFANLNRQFVEVSAA